MKKEKITQSDAVLLLLKYKPKSALDMIEGELPAYYRKDLPHTLQKMINKDLINRKIDTTKIEWKYGLTPYGKKILYKRFAQLRHDDSTVNELEGLVYAFGM
jgi:DNA-binding HxlR family transcriptional regulator